MKQQNYFILCRILVTTQKHGIMDFSFNTQNSPNNNPSNYRRIILLNSLGKLLSSLVYNHVENEIERKDILSPNQAGFIKKITKQVTKYLHFLV